MNVTFWGVRGAIPTPQLENLGFGGQTPCVELEAEGKRIVLDAGTGLRQLGYRMLHGLGPLGLNEDILLSHFHWDHVQGIPYFAPLFQEWNLSLPLALACRIFACDTVGTDGRAIFPSSI